MFLRLDTNNKKGMNARNKRNMNGCKKNNELNKYYKKG